MLAIRLIGRPRLELDGEPIAGPRGNKTWALLARLIRSEDPVSRQRLIEELFSEADDPMGALRWSLAELRRRTGLVDAFKGNPLSAELGADTIVDVDQVRRGAVPDDIPEGEFLEGVAVAGSASFDTWLLIERQRVASEVLSCLRQATLRALSSHQPDRAVTCAAAMVQRNPLDEGPHVLLVKALATAGDADAALHQVEVSEAMFRRELGVEPTPAIRGAARARVASPVPGVSSHTSATTLRDAGLTALSAGAADAGIECLRGATAAAETTGDTALLGECLMELGTALVHAIRGYDDEGAVVLGQAVQAATDAGSQITAAKALSELVYVDMLAGRRDSATRNLVAASELAGDDPALVAVLAGFEAMNLSDWGKTGQAADRFAEAVELSQRAGVIRRVIWALGLGARTLFIEGRLAEAADWARRSSELAQQERWTAFQPWPDAWSAHVRLANGEPADDVRRDSEATFTLARQLQDPCWEGVAAKVIGLTYLADGEYETAMEWMTNASTSCRRVTDTYTWVGVEILIAEAAAAQAAGDRERAECVARRAVGEAAAGSMDGLLDQARSVLTTL
ncbi:MAG TPA: BTAD domain-containing putative transcriptional regulator [Acidimicrobiales bacterium]|nr:BTAD domain-containing putative transcriptional regulator [Acidimicrobiales bacterium]